MTVVETYVHYSESDHVELNNNWRAGGWLKPKGFWFTVLGHENDTTWLDFCLESDFGCLDFVHLVTLSETADLLRLRSPHDLDSFTTAYGAPRYLGGPMGGIDWPTVAREWQGVIIAPYQWPRRMTDHTSWYYGWDCSSGVIWDTAAVDMIKLVGKGPERD